MSFLLIPNILKLPDFLKPLVFTSHFLSFIVESTKKKTGIYYLAEVTN